MSCPIICVRCLSIHIFFSLPKHFAESKAIRENGVYPMHLNTLIELTAQDPDPYFFGSYNSYFTGGTLDVMTANDVDFLFHVSGPNLNVFSE